MANSIYELKANNINGEEVSFNDYNGKVLLIVNVASKCGFTPQYKGLEDLYKKFKDKGVEVLGFPCNQFGSQEPGDENEIQKFCSLTYDVSFPMFSKVDVNGDNTHPIFQYLKSEKPGVLGTEMIKWNFTKFLVDRKGNVLERFAPKETPESLVKKIEGIL